MPGCSLFSSKQDAPADGNAFRATVSTTANPMPVPVEIARDISLINQGQAIPADPSGWQPTNPTVGNLEEEAGKAVDAKAGPESSSANATRQPAEFSHKGKNGKWVVKNGDTLMKIAFETYGNVYRWREIYQANKKQIQNYNSLVDGTVLTLLGVEYVVIHHNGKPYLIRKNDTLVKISNGLYGTPKQWSQIWHNNPELIHDPNKIYAGFTLYYVPKAEPSLAMKKPPISLPRSPSAKN